MSKVFASLAVLSLALLARSTPALAQSTETAQSGYVSPTGVHLVFVFRTFESLVSQN